MARNTALFQNAANTKNTRPQRLGASLRSGPWGFASSLATPSQAPLYVTTGSLGSISFFCCHTGVRGFESSLSTPSQAVRLRSLHRLPNVRRPLRGFKLGGHAPANSLTNRKSASVSEPKFEPRKGRQPLGRWWSGEAAEPLLAKKKKIEPGATER